MNTIGIQGCTVSGMVGERSTYAAEPKKAQPVIEHVPDDVFEALYAKTAVEHAALFAALADS